MRKSGDELLKEDFDIKKENIQEVISNLEKSNSFFYAFFESIKYEIGDKTFLILIIFCIIR